MSEYVEFVALCGGCYGVVVAAVTGWTVLQWRLWVMLLAGGLIFNAGKHAAAMQSAQPQIERVRAVGEGEIRNGGQ